MRDVNVHPVGGTREPDVTVIVPAFNAKTWIRETLRSVLNQTIDPARYEIIVVDNGSQDLTLDVAAAALRTASARITLSHEPKRGPAHARNHGLRLARGTWVQFLDADDVLHNDKLARQLAFAESCRAEVGLIYSTWQSLEVHSEIEWTKGPPHLPRFDESSLSARLGSMLDSSGFFQLGSSLFRREALLAVDGCREVGIIEDVDLYIRLAIAGWDFVHCFSPEPLFFYRRHRAASLSTRSSIAFADGVERNAALVESWARAHDILDRPLSSRVTACYFQAARMFAGRDWMRFDSVVERIAKLNGTVIPPSRALSMLSRLIGYKAAERVAVYWRRFKEFASVGSPSLYGS
jgi:glycosyltransferase involved in cell wall biosynthesis